jgi:hypothetical protein
LNQSEALTRGVPWHFGRIRPCNRVAWHPCQTRRVHRLIHEYGQKKLCIHTIAEDEISQLKMWSNVSEKRRVGNTTPSFQDSLKWWYMRVTMSCTQSNIALKVKDIFKWTVFMFTVFKKALVRR